MNPKQIRGRFEPSLNRAFLVGGSLYWAYVNLLFSMNPAIIPEGLSASPETIWTACLVGNLVSLSLCILLTRKHSPIMTSRFILAFSTACIVLSSLFKSGVDFGIAFPYSLVVAGFLGGFGTGFTFVFIAEFCSRIKPQTILLHTGFQTLLGAMIYLLLAFIATRFAILLVIPLAWLSNWLFSKAFKQIGNRREGEPDPPSATDKKLSPWFLMLLPLFVGLVYGIIRVSITVSRTTSFILNPADMLGALLASILLIGSSVFATRFKLEDSIYLIMFPVLGFSLLSVPLLLFHVNIGLSIVLTGLAYFYGLLWALISVSRQIDDDYSSHLASKVFLCLQGGQLVGVAASRIGQLSEISLLWLTIVVLFLLVLLTILFFLGEKQLEKEIRKKAVELGLSTNMTQVSKRYNLTPKEEEVYGLLIRGFSLAQIEKRLAVSENTARTHVKHIYTKLDVHSRYELMTLASESIGSNEVGNASSL